MPQSQRDVRNRIGAVKNIQKITRAMEMVAAARLRRAEQRIEALRPYANAIRRMTRQAAEAAGRVPQLPILEEHDQVSKVGLLLIAGDRGLAGAFNSQIVRAGVAAGREHDGDGRSPVYFASGRRPATSLTFRGLEPAESFTGFTDRPAYADARRIAERLMAAYVDGEVDQVEIFYNGYISPVSQVVRRETLLPLQQATVLEEESDDEEQEGDGDRDGRSSSEHRALVEYEPDPEEILKRLVPDYVEISIYRALLESTASEHGARMTAMRNASENAGELIQTLTLEMNRARQAEITQEILEVVAGAEGLSG
jgi:F-type H+-transporting ATPase subunit gamma